MIPTPVRAVPESPSDVLSGRSKLRFLDALREGSVSIVRRPGRTVLTALGTILGVGTIVATLGIVGTANQQVSAKFNALLSTQVSVSDLHTGDIPLSSTANVLRLSGVRAAGVSWQVDGSLPVASDPNPATSSQYSHLLPLYAATPTGLHVMGAHMLIGRLFDAGNERRADHVALLGSIAAKALGITTVVNQPAIFVDGVPFTVIGIVSGLARQPGALGAVIIPATTAQALVAIRAASNGQPANSSLGTSGGQPAMLITTAEGAAQVVGGEVVYAINPRDPSSLAVTTPPDPTTLRQQVEGATGTLLLLLAGLSLLIGIVAITNTTLLAVLERVPEIGLRRALGARSVHIGLVTLVEAGIVGAIGGIVGTCLGVFVTATVAFVETWTAVLDPRIPLLAPCAGVVAGVLAGLYPAWRATRIEPVAALQR